MKIDELNKENILNIENNLEIDDEEGLDWIECMIEEYTEKFFDFESTVVYENTSIKIYQVNEHNYFFVTNSKDDILRFFEVYDFCVRYETKYEYVFVGHEMNCHIDKSNGEFSEYPTR